jgi:hypothetical protein
MIPRSSSAIRSPRYPYRGLRGSADADHQPFGGAVLLFCRQAGLLFVFLNPSIDFRSCNLASSWLMRAQGACSDLQSFGQHRLRKLLGLDFSRE